MHVRALPRVIATISAAMLLAHGPAAHADLQDDLNARWRGAWVIVTGDLFSNCNGTSTDNRINNDLLSGSGRYEFEPGELGRIARVDVRRRRVDVFVDLQESLLLEYQDGPFTLYRETNCEVELLFEGDGERTRDLGMAGVEAQFAPWFERHTRRSEAEASASWNGRIRDDYPEDYDLTLAEYEAWRIEQQNRLIDEKIAYSNSQVSYLLSQVLSDEQFGAGLAFGIASMREAMAFDCDRLISSGIATFSEDEDNPDPDWGNGYRLGQALAYHVELSRRLSQCYLR